MLAEPEIRQFVGKLGDVLPARAMKKGAPPTPQGQVLGAEGPKLIRALLTHRTALFVSKVTIGPQGPDIAGGAIVATGNETDELKAALERVEKVLLGDGAGANDAKAKWHPLPRRPGTPQIEWGFHDRYLIVGIGTGSADAIVSRFDGKPPAWLTALKEKLPVERVGTVLYLNAKQTIALAPPFLGEQGGKIVKALGLDNVQTIAMVGGLEGSGCVSKAWIRLDGDPRGLLTLFGPEPLQAADLAPIPKDASLAFAARLQPARLFAALKQAISDVDPASADRFAEGVKEAESEIGASVNDDLLQSLGDSWCVYNSPGEGGLWFTGLTLVAPVKDHERLLKFNDQLVKFARTKGHDGTNQIKETEFQGQKIYYLTSDVSGSPFSPAWCVADKQVIVALSPQNVRAFLSHDPAAGSLADVPSVAERFKSGGPVLLAYQDTAAMLKLTYPIFQLIMTMGFPELRRHGLDVDVSLLPSLASIVRHVEPSVSTLSRDKDGLLYVSRASLPVGSGWGSAPFWFLFLARPMAVF